jgi:alanine dehydrogenase
MGMCFAKEVKNHEYRVPLTPVGDSDCTEAVPLEEVLAS